VAGRVKVLIALDKGVSKRNNLVLVAMFQTVFQAVSISCRNVSEGNSQQYEGSASIHDCGSLADGTAGAPE
jgi:hypothetical protein